MNQLSSAISEYVFYGTKSNVRFKISRNGIRFNSSSESKNNFNKWLVISSPGMGGSQILSVDNKWHSILHNSHPYKDKYYFDSAEDAINALNKIENEQITPYPATTLLSTMLENNCFPDNLSAIISKDTDFSVWNEGEYSDLELELTVSEDDENDSMRTSMNLHVVFDWDQSIVSVDLGTNMGDGFNEGIKLELDITKSFSDQFLFILNLSNQEDFYRYVHNLRHDTDEFTIKETINSMALELEKLQLLLDARQI